MKDKGLEIPGSARRNERKDSRVPTIVSQMLAPLSAGLPFKKESFRRERVFNNIKQEMILKLKYKEPKEQDSYTKTEAELEDLLTMTI